MFLYAQLSRVSSRRKDIVIKLLVDKIRWGKDSRYAVAYVKADFDTIL